MLGVGLTQDQMTDSTRPYYYFAFTFRFFSIGRGGPAKCGREVLKT